MKWNMVRSGIQIGVVRYGEQVKNSTYSIGAQFKYEFIRGQRK